MIDFNENDLSLGLDIELIDTWYDDPTSSKLWLVNWKKEHYKQKCIQWNQNQNKMESCINQHLNKIPMYEIFVKLTWKTKHLFIPNTKAGSNDVWFREVLLY